MRVAKGIGHASVSLPVSDRHEHDIHPIRALLLVYELHGSEDVLERPDFDFGAHFSVVRSLNGAVEVSLAEKQREESVLFRLDSEAFGLDKHRDLRKKERKKEKCT